MERVHLEGPFWLIAYSVYLADTTFCSWCKSGVTVVCAHACVVPTPLPVGVSCSPTSTSCKPHLLVDRLGGGTAKSGLLYKNACLLPPGATETLKEGRRSSAASSNPYHSQHSSPLFFPPSCPPTSQLKWPASFSCANSHHRLSGQQRRYNLLSVFHCT